MAAVRARLQVREWRIPQVRRTHPNSVPEPLCEQITQALESEDPGSHLHLHGPAGSWRGSED